MCPEQANGYPLSLSYPVQVHHTWEVYELLACIIDDGLTIVVIWAILVLMHVCASLYLSDWTQSSFLPSAGKIHPFQYFLYRLLTTCPLLFPRPRLNHLSRLRSNHLGGQQRKYTSLLYGKPFLSMGRDAFLRSCLSGAVTCLCGCQLSLGRSAQGAAFLTHPRSRYLSNLRQQ